MIKTYKKFIITEKIQQEIEHVFEKPLSELTDDDAKSIVEDYLAVEVDSACFSTEDEIWYVEKEYEDDDYKDPIPAFTEEYLNYIGMSKSDFV